jgi:hypothetical protein
LYQGGIQKPSTILRFTGLLEALERLHRYQNPSIRQAAIALCARQAGVDATAMDVLWQRWQHTQLEFAIGGGK